jgi:hypothetical protein
MSMDSHGGIILTGENLSQRYLSSPNPALTDLGANPGLRGERPAINRLWRGTALPLVFNKDRGKFYSAEEGQR